MDYYTARSMDDLFAWMCSEELSTELEDGGQWLSDLREVDGQPFSANVYEPFAVRGVQAPPDAAAYILRVEVESKAEAQFDDWLVREHLPRFQELPGFLLARAFTGVRNNVPIALYRSPGSRMLRVDIARPKLREALASLALTELLAAEDSWCAASSYCKSDLFVHLFHFDSSTVATI